MTAKTTPKNKVTKTREIVNAPQCPTNLPNADYGPLLAARKRVDNLVADLALEARILCSNVAKEDRANVADFCAFKLECAAKLIGKYVVELKQMYPKTKSMNKKGQ